MFNAKAPAEIITLTFDFSALTASVSAPVTTVSLQGGIDPSPGALKSGNPQVNGAKVLQLIQGGVVGAQYRCECLVTAADGVSKYLLADVLPCLPG